MFSIQVSWLPGGTGIFGRMSSGADTEVRPPAILGWGPEGGFLWLGAQRGYDTSRYSFSAYDALLALYGPRTTVLATRHPPPTTHHPPPTTHHPPPATHCSLPHR